MASCATARLALLLATVALKRASSVRDGLDADARLSASEDSTQGGHAQENGALGSKILVKYQMPWRRGHQIIEYGSPLTMIDLPSWRMSFNSTMTVVSTGRPKIPAGWKLMRMGHPTTPRLSDLETFVTRLKGHDGPFAVLWFENSVHTVTNLPRDATDKEVADARKKLARGGK